MTSGLDLDTIAQLLKDDALAPQTLIEQRLGKYHNARNTKHVTWHDTEMRCSSRRCGSPTYIKVMGMPKCQIHTILMLAEMLDPSEGVTE